MLLQHRQSPNTRLMQGLGDLGAAQAFGLCLLRHLIRRYRLGQGQSPLQSIALRIGVRFATQPPARVTQAGQQDVVHALRLAKGIAALEQSHQRGCTQAHALMDLSVLASHHFGQFAAGCGHAQALAQLTQQLDAAGFVANMARPFLRRRQAFAQIVAQAGKAHRQ